MKRFILFALSGLPAALYSQHVLQSELNLPRAGDEVIKQQVRYVDPGPSGENLVWDFSRLQVVNAEYRVSYRAPSLRHDTTYVLGRDTFLFPEGLIIVREHYTNYFYRFEDSIFSVLGYENKLDLMHHTIPLPEIKFPMAYGDSLYRSTRSEDLFCGQVPIFTHGETTLVADAYGILILPSGDTLSQVLRTRSVRQILSDNVAAMDSIPIDTDISVYRWYARGYRYPLFETVRTTHTGRSGGAGLPDVFETAFFFPPPQDNLGGAPDSANRAERELIWSEQNGTESTGNPWEGMTCHIFPNPVVDNLQFDLYLPRPCREVRVQIRNREGMACQVWNKGYSPEGVSTFSFNISRLPPDNYVLDFELEGFPVRGAVVMKR